MDLVFVEEMSHPQIAKPVLGKQAARSASDVLPTKQQSFGMIIAFSSTQTKKSSVKLITETSFICGT